MSVIAVVLGAGEGLRFGGALKKQFCLLKGRPLLVRSVFQFEATPEIDEIICVVPDSDQVAVEALFATNRPTKLTNILPGGPRRQDSVARALDQLSGHCQENDIIAIHDGVRPLIRPDFIQKLIQQTRQHGAAVAARPITDSLKRVSQKGFIMESLPRASVWAMQTPQMFQFCDLVSAYKMAARDKIEATDDAALVSLLGRNIACIEGPADNIKITQASDLALAEFLWDQQDQNRTLSTAGGST